MRINVKTWAAIVLAVSAHFAQGGQRQLLIVAEPHPPHEMLNQGGQVIGSDIDILTCIFHKLGIGFEVRIVPWKRAWSMIETGEADAGLSVSFTEERKPYMIWPRTSVWVSQFVFFTQKANKQASFDGYDDAKKQRLKIGIIAGNAYHPSFWQAFPYQDAAHTMLHPQLEAANNIDVNMHKLAGRRFDLFPLDLKSGQVEIERLHLQEAITWYDKVLFSKPYFMPFAKKSTYPGLVEIAERFDRELALLKQSGEYDKIMQKWLH